MCWCGCFSEQDATGTLLGDLDDHILRQQNILLLVQERIAHSQLEQALVYNRKHLLLHFNPGDLVLVHRNAYFPQFAAGRKLHHIWYGLFP